MRQIENLRHYQPAGLERFTAASISAQRAAVPLPRHTAAEPTLQAEINHGRWIVRCPSCAGAELVDIDDRRFFCLSCHNSGHGGKWLPVTLPPPVLRARLESELLKRPRRDTHNWLPGETLQQLQAENAAKGVS